MGNANWKADSTKRTQSAIAILALAAITAHVVLRYVARSATVLGPFPLSEIPLIVALVFGGAPLVLGLTLKLFRREFGSDLLAGISIVTSVFLGEYLASVIVVLML